MAPNTSSLFNESSAEASSADSAVMVSKTTAPPADGPSPAAATSAPSAAAATSTTTVSSAPSECRASPPAVVLACRKSCLKRSSSTVDVLSSSSPVPRPPSTVTVGPSPPRSPGRPVQKNRRRCWQCRAKVGLTAVTCRCEYTFCTKHRYAEEHSCSFNFKSAGKRKLEEENPRVVPLKVARIN